MSLKKILITTSSFGRSDGSVLDAIKAAGYEPVLNPYGRKLTEDEVSRLIGEVKPVGMIAGVEPLTGKVLEEADGLKVISRCGIGMDSVDMPAAERLGISVRNTPDAPTLAVAELTVGLMIDVLRRISLMDRSIRSGGWDRPTGMLLSQKTVGIVGCGRIGTSVAKLLEGFQCELIGSDSYIETHPLIEIIGLDSLFARADIISFHVPYSEETHHMINADNVSRVKKGAIVVNTSRGGIIDEDVVYQALIDGHLGGAGIDCYEQEPYKGRLIDCEQAVLTSHVGSYAKESRVQMEREAADNLLEALNGLGEF